MQCMCCCGCMTVQPSRPRPRFSFGGFFVPGVRLAHPAVATFADPTATYLKWRQIAGYRSSPSAVLPAGHTASMQIQGCDEGYLYPLTVPLVTASAAFAGIRCVCLWKTLGYEICKM